MEESMIIKNKSFLSFNNNYKRWTSKENEIKTKF
jgi:hypothetical protein